MLPLLRPSRIKFQRPGSLNEEGGRLSSHVRFSFMQLANAITRHFMCVCENEYTYTHVYITVSYKIYIYIYISIHMRKEDCFFSISSRPPFYSILMQKDLTSQNRTLASGKYHLFSITLESMSNAFMIVMGREQICNE